LLDNALKYTPKGSHIDVSARRREQEVEVCIRDNGPGIPADDLPHIFERFYRVDKGRSRDKGGTGLGLSIVKHIVQLHGGRVWVESTLGQGTAFFFGLPVRVNS
jgi:two-component system phosphate regulon sensor histidine kinase PhoR